MRRVKSMRLNTTSVFMAGVGLALLLLLVVALSGPFRSDRVGAAGEWFAGLAGVAVLAWAVGEPRRAADARRAMRFAELSPGVIRKLHPLTPREVMARLDYAEASELRDELEIAAAFAPERLAVRLRGVAAVFLALAVAPEGGAQGLLRGPLTQSLAIATVDQLRAGLTGYELPPWQIGRSCGTFPGPTRADAAEDWMQSYLNAEFSPEPASATEVDAPANGPQSGSSTQAAD